MTIERRVKYYEGTHEGMIHQSIYPKLFRATFKRRMNGRNRDVVRLVTQHSAESARSRIIYGDPHGEIRSDTITVEFLMDLAPVYSDERVIG